MSPWKNLYHISCLYRDIGFVCLFTQTLLKHVFAVWIIDCGWSDMHNFCFIDFSICHIQIPRKTIKLFIVCVFVNFLQKKILNLIPKMVFVQNMYSRDINGYRSNTYQNVYCYLVIVTWQMSIFCPFLGESNLSKEIEMIIEIGETSRYVS